MPLPKEKKTKEPMSAWERYKALPEMTMAEFIDGKIYMMAPPTLRHQRLSGELFALIHERIRKKGGPCQVIAAPFSVRLQKSKKNYVEPDITVVCDKTKLTDKGCVGAPDWIIEIVSPSDPQHDYIEKLMLYKKAGVREYWIVDPKDERVLVYRMEKDDFHMTAHTFSDKVSVGIFEGFSINFAAIKKALS